MLEARPAELAKRPAALRIWRAVMPAAREQRFRQRTGVDPLAVTSLVLGELVPSGYLLLARGPFDADLVVREAGARLAVLQVVRDEPVLRREGLAGVGRYAYAVVDEHTVMVARDAPPDLLARFARRVVGDDVTAGALEGPDAAALYRPEAGLLAVYVPQPLGLSPDTGVGLLLSRERALAARFDPGSTDMAVELALRGEFPPGVEDNFRALVRSLGRTPLGAALGLADIPALDVRRAPHALQLRFSLQTRALLRGIDMLFSEDLRRLLE